MGGITTKYLISEVNPTGYPQVVGEYFSGNTTPPYDTRRVYVYGLDRISQYRNYFTGTYSLTQTSYYVYDGHGSVRALTDPNGNITDTYDYDAFGNVTHSTTTLSSPTPNEFLFAGEQYDSNLSLYYNRARYLNVTTGRFWTMDQFAGEDDDPFSLHKYVFAYDDPTDVLDPGGQSGETDYTAWGRAVHKKISADFLLWLPLKGHTGYANKSIKTVLGLNPGPRGSDIYVRPDLVDTTTKEIYEIKPLIEAEQAQEDLDYYISVLADNNSTGWRPGRSFSDPQEIPVGNVIATVEPTINGAILYSIGPGPRVPGLIPITVESLGFDTIAAAERVAAAAEASDLAVTEGAMGLTGTYAF